MQPILDDDRQVIVMDSVCHDARMAYAVMAEQAGAPHVLMRPALSRDGNQWCALYGDNLQDGVGGFGDSPAEAMADVDKNCQAKLAQPAGGGE